MFKFIHTADLHLGAKAGWLGTRATSHRKLLLDTFAQICDETRNRGANALVIAGDLFDTPYPSTNTINYVQSRLEALARGGTMVLIVAGNHDRYIDSSVYSKLKFSNPLIHVFSPEKVEVIESTNFAVRFFSQSIAQRFSTSSTLGRLIDARKNGRMDGGGFTDIAIVHGSVELGSNTTNHGISKEEITNSGFAYIALGDWHGLLEVSNKATKAWYPGSPQPLAFDQKMFGHVLEISVEPGVNERVEVMPIKISELFTQEVTFDCSKQDNHQGGGQSLYERIDRTITGLSNKNLLLEMKLSGIIKPEMPINLGEILEADTDKFYLLRIINLTKIGLTQEEIEAIPETTVSGRLIRIAKHRLEIEKDENVRKIIEQALVEGLQKLSEL